MAPASIRPGDLICWVVETQSCVVVRTETTGDGIVGQIVGLAVVLDHLIQGSELELDLSFQFPKSIICNKLSPGCNVTTARSLD